MRRITSVLPILLFIGLQTIPAQTPTWRPKPQTSHDLTEDVNTPPLPQKTRKSPPKTNPNTHATN